MRLLSYVCTQNRRWLIWIPLPKNSLMKYANFMTKLVPPLPLTSCREMRQLEAGSNKMVRPRKYRSAKWLHRRDRNAQSHLMSHRFRALPACKPLILASQLQSHLRRGRRNRLTFPHTSIMRWAIMSRLYGCLAPQIHTPLRR
jgi:hypothetical protein